jgi:2-polyprenyl-3-methyl-5-hydroxy-6-metoxy-1,4-benzoquinol methylase
MGRDYQFDFSSKIPGMYDITSRERKAQTMVAILTEFLGVKRLAEARVLDVGSSTGIIDHYLANHVGSVTGIDIDSKAIRHANQIYQKQNLQFIEGDAMNLQYPDRSYDLVICSHIYEHVPDSKKLIQEIFRVLKPGGVCFFSAGNRINLIEPHYRLPLLSVMPKFLAHLYMRIARKGTKYYEEHLTYWGLKKLTCQFHLHDYTRKIVNDPARYQVSYMLGPNSATTRFARFLAKYFYWAFPSYIWLLQKPQA